MSSHLTSTPCPKPLPSPIGSVMPGLNLCGPGWVLPEHYYSPPGSSRSHFQEPQAPNGASTEPLLFVRACADTGNNSEQDTGLTKLTE